MSGCLQFLKYVYNYSDHIVSCNVVNGCIYSQLHLELCCLLVESCNEL